MTTLRCPSCGHENPTSNSFCAKCTTYLGKEAARANRNNRIFLPPQVELAQKKPAASSRSFPALALVLVVIVLAAIVIYYLG